MPGKVGDIDGTRQGQADHQRLWITSIVTILSSVGIAIFVQRSQASLEARLLERSVAMRQTALSMRVRVDNMVTNSRIFTATVDIGNTGTESARDVEILAPVLGLPDSMRSTFIPPKATQTFTTGAAFATVDELHAGSVIQWTLVMTHPNTTVTESNRWWREISAWCSNCPKAAVLIATPLPDNAVIYTVKPGDTLYGIAFQHDITVAELVEANQNLSDPNFISAGDQIVVGSRRAQDGLPQRRLTSTPVP